VSRPAGILHIARSRRLPVAFRRAHPALARAFLDNPRWLWHAADVLGEPLPVRRNISPDRRMPVGVNAPAPSPEF
jgi:hypothetical protein